MTKDKHYFNTAGESGSVEIASERKALSQEKQILAAFAADPFRTFGASELSSIFPYWPITSIRRALNKLHDPKEGEPEIVRATSAKGAPLSRVGKYGKKELLYTLRKKEPQLIFTFN